MTEALALIDRYLHPTAARSMYSADEVQDLLLDIRLLIQVAQDGVTEDMIREVIGG